LATIWLTYFIVATIVSGIFVATGWRGTQMRNTSWAQIRHRLSFDPSLNDADGGHTIAEAQADVAAAVCLAVKRLSPVMANQSVQTEIAVPPGLLVRMRPAILADLVEDLLTAAVHGAPASRLLLTAAAHGERTYVTVTDDMPGADPMVRKASVRGLSGRIALRGGVLSVDVSPMEGTSMTLRFASVLPDYIACTAPVLRKPVPAQTI
jgi:hypothetical protein